jgi:hypothetical protein
LVRWRHRLLMRRVVAVATALLIAAAPAAARSLFSGKTASCNKTPSALCTLTPIAWEGGPGYWAHFAPTAAAGWTNPSFFPVVVFRDWTTTITSGTVVSNYQAVGVNTLTMLPPGTNMALLRSAGMWAIPSIDLTCGLPSGLGSETVGWLVADEPELIYGPGSNTWTGACTPRDQTQCGSPNCGFTVANTLKATLPADGHPYGINFSINMLATSRAPGLSGPQQLAFVNGYPNMWDSMDVYWYANAFQCPASQGGAQALGLPFTTALTSTQCHRSSNYGTVIRGLRALVTSPLRPVWGFVEAGCVECNAGAGDVSITGVQLQGAVWSQIISEARGMQIFTPNLAGSCTGDVIQLNCGSINSSITTVLGQVSALATVLNTQSFQWSFNANLDSMLKFGPDGKWYVFAMQTGFNNSGTYTFTLPTGMTTATTATVLNESRTVSISAGAFSDTFSNEYTYHIYQISP